jgi:hypothetical protein
MAEKTTNLGLTKPTPEDFYDVHVQNENMDKIDYHLTPLIVTFSGTTEEDYAIDKTFDEIKQAWDDNRRILMIERQRNYPYIYYPALISDSDAVFVRLYENKAATIIFSKYDYIAKEEYSFLTKDHATDTNAHNDIRIIAQNAATLANNINDALKNKANANHSHSATDITKDTLSQSVLPTISILKGGTGATTASDARTNLGITPENIGASPTAHTQAASTITAGIFAGQVIANASGQSPSVSLLRNSKLVNAEENPTVNGEICWTYE